MVVVLQAPPRGETGPGRVLIQAHAPGGGAFNVELEIFLIYRLTPPGWGRKVGSEWAYILGSLQGVLFRADPRLGTPEINTEMIRAVPVQDFFLHGLEALKKHLDMDGALTLSSSDLFNAAKDGPTDSTLELVGRYYTVLADSGENPVTTIANDAGISRSTATRWVKKARELGFIDTMVSDKWKSKRNDRPTA